MKKGEEGTEKRREGYLLYRRCIELGEVTEFLQVSRVLNSTSLGPVDLERREKGKGGGGRRKKREEKRREEREVYLATREFNIAEVKHSSDH